MNAKLKAKRLKLSEVSRVAQILVKQGAFDTVNQVLVNEYQDQTGAKEFNTFHQWKEKGFSVKKGEKSFPVWGSPLRGKVDKSEDPVTKDFSFFPICNLFNDKQVVFLEQENPYKSVSEDTK